MILNKKNADDISFSLVADVFAEKISLPFCLVINSATLSSTGTPSYFVHPTEASHGDLGGIKKNDCITLAFPN